MKAKNVAQPWKKVCILRPEIAARVLSSADFAVDLHSIVSGEKGKSYYCDPKQFFEVTYATANLRKLCALTLKRLARVGGSESIINIAQTFGGGKSHTLAALYYLASLGPKVPDTNAVRMILNEAELKQAPQGRVAAVSFDKVDWVAGAEVMSPDGKKKRLRMPWNLIAYQLLGEQGLAILQRDESKPDFDTPPADTLWLELLREVERSGQGALILLDEFLMWAHDAASPDPEGKRKDRGPVWYDRLKNFFQKLAQAVEKSDFSCLVVSLLATEPNRNDETGKAILNACNGGVNRQASIQSPVERDDLAELLRRRLFEKYPESDPARHEQVLAFWPKLQALDPVRAKMPDSELRMRRSYPFHPDLLDRFFGKWSELSQFQRTRGVLKTFADALREAQAWDESPLIGPQVFLAAPEQDGLCSALLNLANIAKDSVPGTKMPPWPENLKTELPRARQAQKQDAPTLSGREIEAACVATFIYSQPIGEQAELNDLRWLIGVTCDLPAAMNNGLIGWSKVSWYLEECDAPEAGTGVPKFWRLGPKPNLNQLHHHYKQQSLRNARSKFDDLAKDKCTPLYEGTNESGVTAHKLPQSPADVGDDGGFRLVVLGARYAGTIGAAPNNEAVDYIRTHSSAADTRTFQNIVLVVTPSVTGLAQAEQALADWMAWGEIRSAESFKDLETHQQESVRKRERESMKAAQDAVKNAYELVLFLHSDGSIQARRITLGAESLMATLLKERELRLFREKIDAEAIMPGGAHPVWPGSDPSIKVSDLYQAFGQQARLPKLLNRMTVVNTIADAVKRGLLAVRCSRTDGSAQWFWRSSIDMADWEKNAEAWLPGQALPDTLSSLAVIPESLPGLWPEDGSDVKLSTLCSWFDGGHSYMEKVHPDYPPIARPMPKVDYRAVHLSVSAAVAEGKLWLVYGNDSVYQDKATATQLDSEAILLAPPASLAAMDFLPGKLVESWSKDPDPATTVEQLYAGVKAVFGRPWPPKLFLDGLNAAIGQGYITRASGSGPLSSLAHDGKVTLVVKTAKPVTPPPPPITGGRRASSTVTMAVSEVQNLADELPKLTKALAGCDPQVEIRITVKPDAKPAALAKASAVLAAIKDDWKL